MKNDSWWDELATMIVVAGFGYWYRGADGALIALASAAITITVQKLVALLRAR